MKKKLLECNRHGLTLHRVKRKVWHTKKKEFSTAMEIECYKCLQEGKHINVPVIKQKKRKHISLK